uniref:Pyrin domain-containing protein n=1 Tax=Paramormyrops kingsleyae TaxID=1676925 RepID=A0A3B3QZS4_9TELE
MTQKTYGRKRGHQNWTSLPDLLLDYLKELSEEELKEFKWKLSHTKYKELKPLPRGQVKDLDRTDLADKMISSYSEVDALNVMFEILKNMNLNDLAQRLNEDLQKRNQERQREDGPEIHGAEILKQTPKERGTPGASWSGEPRTEMAGDPSLVACAPSGVVGEEREKRNHIFIISCFSSKIALPLWHLF